VKPLTGRHHQIRVQLAAIGCIIKGDLKYGARRSNKDASIHLHAHRIQIMHPVLKEEMTFEAPLPDDPVWNNLKEILPTK
jgi:23S rRNA pseudouridine1911/1915/1917 synthase